MSPELIVAVLGIPVAGLVSYIVGRRTERARSDNRRRVVATALLAELQSLEPGLPKLARQRKAAQSTKGPDDSNFATFRSDLFLFDQTTAQALVVFYGLIKEINASRTRMRDEGAKPGNPAHRFVRVKAIYAANRIPELRQLLESAGGSVIPEASVTWVSNREEPILVSPAFEATKQLAKE